MLAVNIYPVPLNNESIVAGWYCSQFTLEISASDVAGFKMMNVWPIKKGTAACSFPFSQSWGYICTSWAITS